MVQKTIDILFRDSIQSRISELIKRIKLQALNDDADDDDGDGGAVIIIIICCCF